MRRIYRKRSMNNACRWSRWCALCLLCWKRMENALWLRKYRGWTWQTAPVIIAVKGAFVRVGDSDEPMTAYEIYSYEAFRKKYQDDLREIPRASFASLNQETLKTYLEKIREGKPKLSRLPDEEICELMSITRNGEVTLSAVLLFSPYPQAYFPQLCITAVVVPGKELGETGILGERFLDNQRIEGTLPEMLDGAIQFVRKNMKIKTIIDPDTGKRTDHTDYPVEAVREAVLNALVHRDYSIHTEGMPIQVVMYEDRLEIRNPGGIYGRLRVDQLGKVQPDTRNPVLASALEILGVTENRYSGIPTMRRELAGAGLPEPVFQDTRGSFLVEFYKMREDGQEQPDRLTEEEKSLLIFCRTPRTRREICDYLGLSSTTYAIQRHVTPLVEKGFICLSIPEKPSSPRQLYFTARV